MTETMEECVRTAETVPEEGFRSAALLRLGLLVAVTRAVTVPCSVVVPRSVAVPVVRLVVVLRAGVGVVRAQRSERGIDPQWRESAGGPAAPTATRRS
jgi:hypothetical protein